MHCGESAADEEQGGDTGRREEMIGIGTGSYSGVWVSRPEERVGGVGGARVEMCVKARRGELRAAWCGARQARAGVSRAWSWLADN